MPSIYADKNTINYLTPLRNFPILGKINFYHGE